MKIEYKKNHAITYTEVDQEGKLDLISAFNLVQNMMTEYFDSFKSDNLRLKKNNNAIWVVTKTKMHFNKFPEWRDKVKAKCLTTSIKPIRIQLETEIEDKKGESLYVTKQEVCVIDLDTRKPRKISTVDFPDDMEVEESMFQKPYLRLKEEFEKDSYVHKQKIYSSDIDYSRHTNNVSYIKYIVNTLPCKFFEENKITDFEIHYINESKEGEVLAVYKKEKENSIEFLIMEDEREIARAKCIFEKKV